MIKVFKWLWRMAYERGTDVAMFEIMTMADYHRNRAEAAFLRAKYEPPKEDDPRNMWMPKELTAKEHQAVADALYKLSQRLMPAMPEIRQEIKIDPAIMKEPKL